MSSAFLPRRPDEGPASPRYDSAAGGPAISPREPPGPGPRAGGLKSPAGPAAPTAAPADPADRSELLATANPCGRALFALVRRLVDELEEAAPWSLLFAEQLDLQDQRGRARRLLAVVEQTPGRIALALDALSDSTGAAIEQAAREEAEFYFAALHQMTASDRRLLGAALDRAPVPAPLSGSAGAYLAELATDLKAKYSSAMMGAAAALVSDGRWLGVEVEAALFPEKAEEQTRNRNLLAALAAADGALARLRVDFPWRTLFGSWSAQREVERDALRALAAIPPALQTLLADANRRALFSGDYLLLQRRELLLSSRLRELEKLHLASLDRAATSPGPGSGTLHARLCQLTLELAAVLDVEMLRGLIGKESVLRLHRQRASAAALHSQPREIDPLAELLGEEDLTMFIRLLYGEVVKRSSIVRESGKFALAPALAQNPPPRPARSEGAEGAEGAEGLGLTASARRRAAGFTRLDEQEARRLEAALAKVLSHLTSVDHEPWRAFQMVHKLHARLRALPPTLLAEIHPFLALVRSDLLPLVEEASAAGLLPARTAETLRSSDRRLSRMDPASLERHHEVATDLGRVVRLLSSLTVAVTGGGG